ncbi:MAG: DUF4149 domain-containing protein [Gammaproteobacteria bacterium]
MTLALTVLLTLVLATWLGAIVLQSAVVAPVLFTALDEAQAGRVLRRLFPRFFRFGLVCGAIALACAVALLAGSAPGNAIRPLDLALLGAMAVAQALCLWLVPRINRARDEGTNGAGRFRRLHGLSVVLTLAVLAGAGAVLGRIGAAAV